jgi:hypothetical protein
MQLYSAKAELIKVLIKELFAKYIDEGKL